MSKSKRTAGEGITVRETKRGPSYMAQVWSQRDRKRITKSFSTLSAAKAWRRDALTALDKGTMRAPVATTLREAAGRFLEGARRGEVRNRSGDAYKPSAIRGYEQALRLRVYPDLGDERLGSIRRVDLQDLADRLVAKGLAASTVGMAFVPLKAIYRRAANRGEVAVNPCTGLDLPAIRSGRDRIADPAEAAALLAALPEQDRPLWAMAMYAGLRRGEIMGLRWSDVDLRAGVIHVERSWDAVEGPVGPKSQKGRRRVPIATDLRDYLVALKLRTGGQGLVFGEGERPFRPDQVRLRAEAAWKEAALQRITLHECRHTFASLMIAAGVNAKSLSEYMGHANIAITYDRYGHLMPGNQAEAAGLLDAYLKRARS